MSTEGKPSLNPFVWVVKVVKWLVSQFDDGILIGLSVLGAGLLVIGGMFFIGHMTPKKSVLNRQHIFQNTYGYNSDFTRSYQVSHPAQYQPSHHHSVNISYPKNTYHRSHHVQSYYHHIPDHHQAGSHHSRYNHHMASSHVVSPRIHHQTRKPVLNSSKNSPYSMHRFGRPRGEGSYNSKSYHFSHAGGAHAAH